MKQLTCKCMVNALHARRERIKKRYKTLAYGEEKATTTYVHFYLYYLLYNLITSEGHDGFTCLAASLSYLYLNPNTPPRI